MKLPLFALCFALTAPLAGAAGNHHDPRADAADWLQAAGVIRATPARVSSESVVVRMVRPRFPLEMRVAGQNGFVRLNLTIDDEGNVVDAKVLEANQQPFAREALRAVSQWQFLPAAYPQPGVFRVVRVPIEFALVGSAS